MKNVLPFLILCLLLPACKKDNHSNSLTGQVSFLLGDSAEAFTNISGSWYNPDTLASGVQTQVLQLSAFVPAYPHFSQLYIAIVQNLAAPGTAGINTGAYKDAYCNPICPTFQNQVGCSGFMITLGPQDNTGNQLTTGTFDTTGVLNVTSFSLSPNLASGTFSCTLVNGHGTSYQITNGQFINIPFK